MLSLEFSNKVFLLASLHALSDSVDVFLLCLLFRHPLALFPSIPLGSLDWTENSRPLAINIANFSLLHQTVNLQFLVGIELADALCLVPCLQLIGHSHCLLEAHE